MNSLLTVLGFSLLMLIFFLSLSFVFPVFVCLLVYEILWLEVDQPLHSHWQGHCDPVVYGTLSSP